LTPGLPGGTLWQMIVYVGLGIGLVLLAFGAYRAGGIWLDAGQWEFEPAARLGWALWGALVPARYWWGARIRAMPAEARAGLLTYETEQLELSRADSLPCPLCGAEVPHAWALDDRGHATVAPGHVECPQCDFRLDACRHCTHFMPGSPQSWVRSGWGQSDATFGRCAIYKRVQPVEQAAAPDMARTLKKRGYDQIRGPMIIQDSMLRPDFCRAFEPDRKRIRASQVHWPGAPGEALLRLLQGQEGPKEGPPRSEPSAEDEQWLL
jgi:hypothetical protein